MYQVCESIYDNSDSNTVNTHVYIKCENTQKMLKIGSRNQFDKWSIHVKNARYSGLSGFSIDPKCQTTPRNVVDPSAPGASRFLRRPTRCYGLSTQGSRVSENNDDQFSLSTRGSRFSKKTDESCTQSS